MENMELMAPKERRKQKKGAVREYAEALITALLIAFLLRSFVVEAFKIPSGSMLPTLVIGDHIFVNKFIYGLRFPFTKTWAVRFSTPERGDAVVFIYPVDEGKDFIKRVVGLPGDEVTVAGQDLFVNGEKVTHLPIEVPTDQPVAGGLIPVVPNAAAESAGIHNIPSFPNWPDYRYFLEELGLVRHLVQYQREREGGRQRYVVPPDHYFVMGDNRDNSADSREWGFVPFENIKGKALFVWLSIDYDRKTLRWNRFGKWIH